MDPLQSWLDTKAVRKMAEGLMAPAPDVDQSSVDAGYGDDFEGFAEAQKMVGAEESKSQSTDAIESDDAAPVAVKPHFSQVPREVPQSTFPTEILSEPEPLAPEHAENELEKSEPDELSSESSGTSARSVVSHALADAKRIAEGSGMLTTDTESGKPSADEAEDFNEITLHPEISPQEESQSLEQPIAPVETALLTPQIASPFQLCDDQSPSDDVPIARQLDSSEELAAAAPVSVEKSEPPSPEPKRAVPQEAPREKVVLPPEPKPTFAKPTSGSARGPFLTRLKEFSSQLRDRLGAKAMFLIDNEGQILIDEVGNTKLIQVARTLANAHNTASRQSEGSADVGNLHVKIGASATLEVIPCRSRYGLLILGVVCPSPLGAARVKQVAEHLAKTVEPAKGV